MGAGRSINRAMTEDFFRIIDKRVYRGQKYMEILFPLYLVLENALQSKFMNGPAINACFVQLA